MSSAIGTGGQLTNGRFARLVKLGALEPSGDALFGVPSQTYRLGSAATRRIAFCKRQIALLRNLLGRAEQALAHGHIEKGLIDGKYFHVR